MAKKNQNRTNKHKKSEDESNITELHPHIALPPQNLFQSIHRTLIAEHLKHIDEPHCLVCGDTEKQCKLLKIPTQNGEQILCQDCYNIQSQM